MHKKILSLLLCLLVVGTLLAACGKQDPPNTTPETSATGDTGDDVAASLDMEAAYTAVAVAAGLDTTVDITIDDLRYSGVVTADNIEAVYGKQSNIQGDSGIVIILQAKPGMGETLAQEMAAYRDTFVNGPGYEEFAEAQEVTRNARIVLEGDYLVYAVPSTNSTADYPDIDAAIQALFAA